MVVAIGRPQMFSFSCTETRDSSIQEEKVHLFDPKFYPGKNWGFV